MIYNFSNISNISIAAQKKYFYRIKLLNISNVMMKKCDKIMMFINDDGLHIIDITDKTNPILEQSVNELQIAVLFPKYNVFVKRVLGITFYICSFYNLKKKKKSKIIFLKIMLFI